MKLALGLLIVALASSATAQTASPQLAEGDILMLRVPDQPELTNTWPIGPGGSLYLPGVGRIEGIRDLDQARELISEALYTTMGQRDPILSVTVQSWRPVIVGGAVAKPGEVPFRLRLRLIEAVTMAGGLGGGNPIGDLSQSIQINQEKERLVQAELRLARAVARQARLIAELDGTALVSLPDSVANLVGAAQADILMQREQELSRLRADNRALTARRIEAAQRLGSEDVEAQQAINESLSRQLMLVRENLVKLEPLFENGSMSGARILELRRDFVDIEGRVGEAQARLAQTLTNQSILAEEQAAFDLQVRLETINELIQSQFEILEAENAIDLLSETMQTAGQTPVSGAAREGDCRAVILRQQEGAEPKLMEADALSVLEPGDFVQIGRVTRECPGFLILRGEVSP